MYLPRNQGVFSSKCCSCVEGILAVFLHKWARIGGQEMAY